MPCQRSPCRLLTNFDDIAADVFETGFNLLCHECRRSDMDSLDTKGILGRQGSRRGHCVAAMGGQNLLICLQATGPG